MVELSVIVPTVDGRDESICTAPLKASSFDDFELIVVENKTASEARNYAIEEADADKLVFLDDDARPHDGYLHAAAQSLDNHAVVTGKVVHPHDNVFQHIATHYDQGSTPRPASHLLGGNMAVRHDVFETVGRFDTSLPYGHEETELFHRIQQRFDVWYNSSMTVTHAYADSLAGFYEKMFRHGWHDPVYWKKTNASTVECLKSLFPYASAETLVSTLIYSSGVAVRDMGVAAQYLRRAYNGIRPEVGE